MTQTFWLERTGDIAWGLRRYRSSDGAGFTCDTGYHDALVYLGRAMAVGDNPADAVSRDDPRWPTTCSRCDYWFTDVDVWQSWSERIWQTQDGVEFVLHRTAVPVELGISTAPPGACWDAYWMPDVWRGPDGISLMVRLPNGHDWNVDSEASNCTRKDEPHECWVRHGDPRDCHVTVDKNGNTCQAGGGSIQAGDFHGFLRDGVLVPA